MGGSGSTGSGLSGSVPPGGHLGGTGSGSAAEPSMPDLFNELTLSGSANSGMSDNGGGSRLSQWKLNTDNLFTNKVSHINLSTYFYLTVFLKRIPHSASFKRYT